MSERQRPISWLLAAIAVLLGLNLLNDGDARAEDTSSAADRFQIVTADTSKLFILNQTTGDVSIAYVRADHPNVGHNLVSSVTGQTLWGDTIGNVRSLRTPMPAP